MTNSNDNPPVASHFMAHISRLKLIYRWPLMRNISRENVQEHSHQVAVVAHCLALIKNARFSGDVNPDEIASAALFHDASEVLTGDLPTPVKYFNDEIASAYKDIEHIAEQKLLEMVPDELKEYYRPLLVQEQLSKEEKAIIKSADTLCAYIKTLEELYAGNHEFEVAKKRLEKSLKDNDSPEVDYFLKVFIPSYTLSLDEISQQTPMTEPQR